VRIRALLMTADRKLAEWAESDRACSSSRPFPASAR
jgi:hypothetical protein